MTEFIWIPTNGSAVSVKPNINVTKFGDSYETRVAVGLLLRPDEVLSGIPDAPVLEVAYNALGILFQPHHVRIGGLT